MLSHDILPEFELLSSTRSNSALSVVPFQFRAIEIWVRQIDPLKNLESAETNNGPLTSW